MNTNIDKNKLHLQYKKDTGNDRPDIVLKISRKIREYISWLEDKEVEQLKIEAEWERLKLHPFTIGNQVTGIVDLETVKKINEQFSQTAMYIIPDKIIFRHAFPNDPVGITEIKTDKLKHIQLLDKPIDTQINLLKDKSKNK